MCVDKLKNLVGKVKTKFPNSSIGVSILIYREDINVDLIPAEVNNQLKRLAYDNNFQFIDNSVIESTCLNNSNLHLNAKGTSLLAVQFIRFLRSSSSNCQFSKDRKSGFRMSLTKLLGETVKTIWKQSQGQH